MITERVSFFHTSKQVVLEPDISRRLFSNVEVSGCHQYALQDKQRQKEHFTEAGVATAAFRGVGNQQELLDAGETFGWPLMLKSRTWGTSPAPHPYIPFPPCRRPPPPV